MRESQRRSEFKLNTEAEKLLKRAVKTIGFMTADARTIQAVLLIESARNIIADIVDENIKNNAFTD